VLQLATGTLFANPGCHPHLRQPSRRCVTRLVARWRAGLRQRRSLGVDGGCRRVPGGSRHGPPQNRMSRYGSCLAAYMVEISTLARVFSHSMRSEQPLPLLSNAIVKFSIGPEVAEVFISTRARSESAPG